MDKNNLIWTCIFLLVLLLFSTFTLALSTSYETTSVSRLVGNTPEDLINQLDTAEYNLNHASYYGQDPPWQGDTYEEKVGLLNYFFSNPYTTSGWTTINLNRFQSNELLVIEADGTINNQRLRSSGLTTTQTSSWKNDFAEHSPVFVFDSDYAGSSIPNQDSYVRSLSRYSTIIAPTFLHSREFVRAFICNLGDGRTIGNSFREARNRYYSFTSPDEDELLGITLMSYHLYGNPLAITTTPNYDNNTIAEYCDQLLGEKEEPRRFGGQSTTKIATFTSTLRTEGEYELVELAQGSLRTISGELALPYTSILQDLPLNAIVTNISYSFSAPQPLVLNIPEFTGDSYQNRSCYEAQKNADVEPKIIYRPDKQTVRLVISPFAITNCSEGEFTFYQTLEYAVDYISPSPIYFSKLQFPQKITPSTLFDLNAELRYVNNIPLQGDLEVWADNQLLSQQEVNSTITLLTVPLTSNSKEGYTSYALYYKQNGTIITSSEFTIETRSADIWLEVPELVSQTANVLLRVYNYESTPLTLSISDNLLWNNTRLTGQNKTYTLPPGLSGVAYQYTSLEKVKQEYPLRFDLGYNNKKEVLHDIIITNHRPLIDATDQTVRAGEEVHLNVSAFDKDSDAITLTISAPVGNDLVWQTQESDAGNYTLLITASDGLSQDIRRISLKVLPNNLPFLEELNTINITAGNTVDLYLFASDADGDNLSYVINSPLFHRLGEQWFQWNTTPSDSGTRTISYSVSDGRATVNHNLIINVLADPCYNITCTNSCQSYTSSENGTCVIGTCQYTTIINSTRCGWKEAACNSNTNCGTNGWLVPSSCQQGNIFANYKTFTCVNPGIPTANCSISINLQLKQNCSFGCLNGTCLPNPCDSCNSNQTCSGNVCVLKTGCQYNASICNSNQTCSGNVCVPKSGCQYNASICNLNQTCSGNVCIPKPGCQYNASICNSNQTCSGNVCILKTGCTYNNSLCNTNENCVNNICQLKTGCQYNASICNLNQTCSSNVCVLKTGCQYNASICNLNQTCTNNVCINMSISNNVTCTDSDSISQYPDGNNPFQKGTTIGLNSLNLTQTAVDSCASNTLILEFYCVGNNIRAINFRCNLNCSNGACLPNPCDSCNSNQTCVNNACILKTGCQYNNPACGHNYNCINNTCIIKSGCNYNSSLCNSGQICINNLCTASSTNFTDLTIESLFLSNRNELLLGLTSFGIVNFTVRNIGATSLTNVFWRVTNYNTNAMIGEGKCYFNTNRDNFTFNPNEKCDVRDLIPDYNCSLIMVMVDPYNSFIESNESNNQLIYVPDNELCNAINNGCARHPEICTSNKQCINNSCVPKVGCAYNNPGCNDNHICFNNICILKAGCTYNNPSCGSNSDCVNNTCVLKTGCQYNNPACNSDQTCSNNACVLNSGCQYNNPSCGSNSDCVNNNCVPRTGCQYNNPFCDNHHDCVNNVCVLKTGCWYDNPACGSNYICSDNICVLNSGCQYNNPVCLSNEDCVNNVCVPRTGCSANNPPCVNDLQCVSNQCIPYTGSLPDLTVKSLKIFDSHRNIDGKTYITAELIVRNIGSNPASNIAWQVNLFNGGILIDSGNIPLPSLASNHETAIYPEFPEPEGCYELLGKVDPSHTIRETDESNNEKKSDRVCRSSPASNPPPSSGGTSGSNANPSAQLPVAQIISLPTNIITIKNPPSVKTPPSTPFKNPIFPYSNPITPGSKTTKTSGNKINNPKK